MPESEVNKALNDAADAGFIDRKDSQPTGMMSVSELCEYISKLRRKHFMNNNDILGMDIVESKRRTGPVPMNEVLKAYKEYKKRIKPNRNVSYRYIMLIISIIVIIYYNYRAPPY